MQTNTPNKKTVSPKAKPARRGRRRKPEVDYAASWAPIIEAANKKVTKETVMHTNAFGTDRVTTVYWACSGPMMICGNRPLNADLNWLQTITGMEFVRVYK